MNCERLETIVYLSNGIVVSEDVVKVSIFYTISKVEVYLELMNVNL